MLAEVVREAKEAADKHGTPRRTRLVRASGRPVALPGAAAGGAAGSAGAGGGEEGGVYGYDEEEEDGDGGDGGGGGLREEDLVPDAPCLLTLSSRGYVKRMRPEAFGAQRRGGKGARRAGAWEGRLGRG